MNSNLKIIVTLCILSSIKCVQGFWRKDLIVKTKLGLIRGIRPDEGKYTMFLGVPYAKVNASNPFGESLPHPMFEGIFEANDDSNKCIQVFHFLTKDIVGTIDCLNVNIHVPDSAGPDNLLPVMIYIYGGQFTCGTAGRDFAGPDHLVRHDVIIVAMNHRVDAYGFMCLDIPEVPGNQGLKDQVKAINWIKDNIEYFGGDVNKITLFGHSSGGMSIGLHLLTDGEKVFKNAILHSGVALYRDLFIPVDKNLHIKLAAHLGLKTNDTYEALSFLSNISGEKVVAASSELDIQYRPCAERIFPGVEPFLTDYPINLKHKNLHNITIMQGHTSEELLDRVSEESYVEHVFGVELIKRDRFCFKGKTLTEAHSSVRRFYIGDKNVTSEIRKELVDFASDYYHVYPTIRSIPRYFEGGVDKVYQYMFSYDGGLNILKALRNASQYPGVTHGDCITYIFAYDVPGLDFPKYEETTRKDRLIIDRYTTMLTNFAKYSDPTPNITELLPVKWEPITKDSPYYYLNINETMVLGKNLNQERMKFWDSFYERYQEYEFGYRKPDGTRQKDEL